jgi:hypothetical protein
MLTYILKFDKISLKQIHFSSNQSILNQATLDDRRVIVNYHGHVLLACTSEGIPTESCLVSEQIREPLSHSDSRLAMIDVLVDVHVRVELSAVG